MLILTNTNSLGLYFDKLCQRVLYTAGNGYRSAQGNVQIWQLFAGQLGGRINRSACFADDQVSNIKMVFFDHLGRKLLCFKRSSSVADSYQGHFMPGHQIHKAGFRLFTLMLAAGDIQRIDRQCTSVGINNGCFTAGAVTGIET